MSGLIALVTIVQLLMWLVFPGKLHSLMNGSSTVNAFYWKFMPIRALFLKEQHRIVANYIFLEITKTMRFS